MKTEPKMSEGNQELVREESHLSWRGQDFKRQEDKLWFGYYTIRATVMPT